MKSVASGAHRRLDGPARERRNDPTCLGVCGTVLAEARQAERLPVPQKGRQKLNSKFRRNFGEYIGRDIGKNIGIKIGELCV